MKKKSILIIALLAFMVGSAQAQWFDFSNNQRASIGLNLGCVGYHFGNDGNHTGSDGIDKPYTGFGVGISMSLAGVYADFIYQSQEHRFSHVVYDPSNPYFPGWNDHTALTINLGYQIPVQPWLFVTPLIGYSNETYGLTKVGTVHVEDDELVHDYELAERFNHFNYGLGLTVKPFKHVEIGAVATAHAVYGNISYSASFKDQK